VTVIDGSETLTGEEEQRILGATRNATARNWNLTNGHKFYLCDTLEGTDFSKTSPGGIMGHRYFDLERVLDSEIPTNVDELAVRLRQHMWA
jgi:hypothetical protein